MNKNPSEASTSRTEKTAKKLVVCLFVKPREMRKKGEVKEISKKIPTLNFITEELKQDDKFLNIG